MGATFLNLALIKCLGTRARLGERRARLILKPILHYPNPKMQISLSSFAKPYLANYDNFKNFSDYSFENPICFLCKEETILFSVWEVGDIPFIFRGKSVSYYESRSVGLLAKNKSLHFMQKKNSLFTVLQKSLKGGFCPLLVIVTKTGFPSLALSKGNFLLIIQNSALSQNHLVYLREPTMQ